MSNLRRKYACKNCGLAYEAYPPDDIHTLAMSEPCFTCDGLLKPKYIKVNYDCENCDFLNVIYWHEPTEHTITERRIALNRPLKPIKLQLKGQLKGLFD